MKLELKHIVGYLPYDLEIYYLGSDFDLETPRFKKTKLLGAKKDEHFSGITFFFMDYDTEKQKTSYPHNPIKPILRPFSDFQMFNEIFEKMTDDEIMMINENPDLANRLSYDVILLMFKNHIDCFGLIQKGLAVDKNKIKN